MKKLHKFMSCNFFFIKLTILVKKFNNYHSCNAFRVKYKLLLLLLFN